MTRGVNEIADRELASIDVLASPFVSLLATPRPSLSFLCMSKMGLPPDRGSAGDLNVAVGRTEGRFRKVDILVTLSSWPPFAAWGVDEEELESESESESESDSSIASRSRRAFASSIRDCMEVGTRRQSGILLKEMNAVVFVVDWLDVIMT